MVDVRLLGIKVKKFNEVTGEIVIETGHGIFKGTLKQTKVYPPVDLENITADELAALLNRDNEEDFT